MQTSDKFVPYSEYQPEVIQLEKGGEATLGEINFWREQFDFLKEHRALAFEEFVRKCKDDSHAYFMGTQPILQAFKFVDKDGVPNKLAKNILLSLVDDAPGKNYEFMYQDENIASELAETLSAN